VCQWIEVVFLTVFTVLSCSFTETDYCYNPNYVIADAGVDEEEDPELDFIGSDACTKSNPCGECQGDCVS